MGVFFNLLIGASALVGFFVFTFFFGGDFGTSALLGEAKASAWHWVHIDSTVSLQGWLQRTQVGVFVVVSSSSDSTEMTEMPGFDGAVSASMRALRARAASLFRAIFVAVPGDSTCATHTDRMGEQKRSSCCALAVFLFAKCLAFRARYLLTNCLRS